MTGYRIKQTMFLLVGLFGGLYLTNWAYSARVAHGRPMDGMLDIAAWSCGIGMALGWFVAWLTGGGDDKDQAKTGYRIKQAILILTGLFVGVNLSKRLYDARVAQGMKIEISAMIQVSLWICGFGMVLGWFIAWMTGGADDTILQSNIASLDDKGKK